ncbi:BioD-like N-terminal domain of phosphotransacetylase [Halapricum desulfuricans]|uniref:BioD-like N-terminal domain of phosphotransacetylase n=1 Tax=Halapricum desulfuricans TaxID=2841257 RepID=A0A897NDG6_9EURY|nr:phosphotransacetylase family protein [Halapricum desulfuricans]QSG12450.1 BioD-like N-terminal domain of phosphotransacetylase [Halapricum desulfuricans]
MDPIVVTSTEAATGKTAVSLGIAQLAKAAGHSVGYMKPKGTRLQSATGKTRDEDPMLARELLDLDAEMHELEPIVYTPTFIEEAIRGREQPAELRERILENYEKQADERDLMVVEGTDRLSTGGIVDLTDSDIAEMIGAKVVLLSRYDEAGDVDEIISAAEQIGDDFAGVLFNAVPDSQLDQLTTDVAPFLENRGIDVLGVIPRVQELAGMTVGELADRLGAEVLTTDVSTDVFIERITVGAMSAEGALTQFRRTQNAAMITGGDRSEIVTAALQASGIKCIILGGGFRPTGAVLGEAEKRGVPVLLLQSDTRMAIDRAEDVLQSGPTRDPETVERMGQLLEDHADVDVLLEE